MGGAGVALHPGLPQRRQEGEPWRQAGQDCTRYFRAAPHVTLNLLIGHSLYLVTEMPSMDVPSSEVLENM